MTGIDQIPFVDLISPHRELRAELVQVFNTALDNAGFIGGPMVATFEHDFAAFCGTSQCVGVSSGTDALRFALMAAGVGDGDVAVTVSNTFTATAEAISQTGARSVFVDIDAGTHNMDPRKLEEYIESHCRVDRDAGYLVDRRLGRRVAAIVPVHLYGQPADMNSILEIAERYNIPVIEDACQAHGAEYYSKDSGSWKKAGSMGRAGAFSFYPGKNLGACGEGGAVTTNDNKLAEKIRMLRDHGQARIDRGAKKALGVAVAARTQIHGRPFKQFILNFLCKKPLKTMLFRNRVPPWVSTHTRGTRYTKSGSSKSGGSAMP